MFEPTSRYAKLNVKTLSVPAPNSNDEPREIRYVERRFLPPLNESVPVIEHTVVEGDRLDNITAKYIGDPTQFWRVADANHQMHPEELTDEPGSRVIITLPR